MRIADADLGLIGMDTLGRQWRFADCHVINRPELGLCWGDEGGFGEFVFGYGAMGIVSMLLPALEMTGWRGERIVYGSDFGVPCCWEKTLDASVRSLLAFEGLMMQEKERIRNGLEKMFPAAAERVRKGVGS